MFVVLMLCSCWWLVSTQRFCRRLTAGRGCGSSCEWNIPGLKHNKHKTRHSLSSINLDNPCQRVINCHMYTRVSSALTDHWPLKRLTKLSCHNPLWQSVMIKTRTCLFPALEFVDPASFYAATKTDADDTLCSICFILCGGPTNVTQCITTSRRQLGHFYKQQNPQLKRIYI